MRFCFSGLFYLNIGLTPAHKLGDSVPGPGRGVAKREYHPLRLSIQCVLIAVLIML
jgi:hypothetical protein